MLERASSALLGAMLLLAGAAAGANQGALAQPAEPPLELVRRAVQNQLNDGDDVRFMYRLRNQTSKGSSTKDLVETDDGIVARLIALDDKPLTPEQRATDDQRLERLMKNPQEQARKQRSQKEDEERAKRLVKALPDAFLYQYDGTVSYKGQELLRLKFTPNPEFDPPTRETQVYRGMQGEMLVDVHAGRVIKIDAAFFRDVTFGWGILGRLDKGGRFMLEQTHVGNQRWEVADMVLDFTGSLLLFKPIKVKQHETISNYQPVPRHLSFSQGVELLKKQDSQIAEKTQ